MLNYYLILAWLVANDFSADFEECSVDYLANLLRQLYGTLRTRDGKRYSNSAMNGIRNALKRYLQLPPYSRCIDIIKDPQFISANKVFTGQLNIWRQQGCGTEHTKVIADSDVEKMYASKVLSNSTATSLQRKVFFEISRAFGVKGRIGFRQLEKSSFIFQTDNRGEEYATLNVNGKLVENDPKLQFPGTFPELRMYGQSELASLKLYLNRLDPASDAFFQQVKPLPAGNIGNWYRPSPMGKNAIQRLMQGISVEAGLSQIYTNKSIELTYRQSRGFGNINYR